MDQEKFGNLIKKIRKDNNLTQKEFADKYNVTYQAVSKWENGKNMPDSLLVKKICDDFNLKIEDLFNGEVKKKKNYISLIVVLGLIVFLIWGLVIVKSISSRYEFKTITTTCDYFKINGSLAYNTRKATIYISNIEYCGGYDKNLYTKLTCTLYEEDGDVVKKISSYEFENEKNAITLETFLKNVKFKVDDYDNICKDHDVYNLYLDIRGNVKESKKTINYRVDLEIDDDCKK